MRNMIRSLVVSSLFLLALAGATLAQTAPTSTTNQISELDINGLKVLIKTRPGTPTVAAGLFIRGGSRNVTTANAGIENLMLSAATEGSKNYPSEMLRKELSRTGSLLSGGSNYDYSGFSLVSTKQNFDRSWDIFTDVVLNPSFAAADVSRARDQILFGLRSETDAPESYLEVLQGDLIYAKHPYQNAPEGTTATVTHFTPADLLAYHKSVMQTSHLLLVIVGNVDPAALQKKIADSFGKLPRGDYKNVPLPALDFSKPSLDTTARTLETNYVKGVFAAPGLNDPDYFAMRVAMALLQQQVFQAVRVERNLSYAPGAEMSSMGANNAFISVSAVNANEAVKVMLDEINKLKTQSIGKEDITAVGNFFLTTYYLKQETNAAQAGELASYELIGGGWRNSQEFLDKMQKVTSDDIKRVANKYMKNIRFIVVGDPKQIDRSIFLQGAE
jgi:zinc protease